jgi:hypothetical protein
MLIYIAAGLFMVVMGVPILFVVGVFVVSYLDYLISRARRTPARHSSYQPSAHRADSMTSYEDPDPEYWTRQNKPIVVKALLREKD